MGTAHSRVVKTTDSFEIGDLVRVQESIATPRYGWGTVNHSSVGTVTAINGTDLTVDFTEQSSWTALASEMELETPRILKSEVPALVSLRQRFQEATETWGGRVPQDEMIWSNEINDGLIASLGEGMLAGKFKVEHLAMEVDSLCAEYLDQLPPAARGSMPDLFDALSAAAKALLNPVMTAVMVAEKEIDWKKTLRVTKPKVADLFFNLGQDAEELEPWEYVVSHVGTCSQPYLDQLAEHVLMQIMQSRESGAAVVEREALARFVPCVSYVPPSSLEDLVKRIVAGTTEYYHERGRQMSREGLGFFEEVLEVLKREEALWKLVLSTGTAGKVVAAVQEALVSSEVLGEGCREFEGVCGTVIEALDKEGGVAPRDLPPQWERCIELFGAGAGTATTSAAARGMEGSGGCFDLKYYEAANQAEFKVESFKLTTNHSFCPSPLILGSEFLDSNLLTLNKSGSSGSMAVRSTTPLVFGQHYWVVNVKSNLGTDTVLGVCNESMSLTRSGYGWLVGEDENSWGWHHEHGLVHGKETLQAGTFRPGDEIGLLLDLDNGTLTFYRQDTIFGVIAGITGPVYPVVSSTCSSCQLQWRLCFSAVTPSRAQTRRFGILRTPFNPLVHAMENTIKARVQAHIDACRTAAAAAAAETDSSPPPPDFLLSIVALCDLETKLTRLQTAVRETAETTEEEEEGEERWKVTSLCQVATSALTRVMEKEECVTMEQLAAAFNVLLSRVKDVSERESRALTGRALIALVGRSERKVELVANVCQAATLRILKNRSVGLEEEASTLTQLGVVCHDSSFSRPVVRLVEELRKSERESEEFWALEAHKGSVLSTRVVFSVIPRMSLSGSVAALTGGESLSFLPPAMVQALHAYSEHYAKKYNKMNRNNHYDPVRQLMWQPSLGSAIVLRTSGSGTGASTVEIECSPYQMAILLGLGMVSCFVPYGELRKLGIPEDELLSALQSLTAPRHAVLLHERAAGRTEGERYGEEDQFKVNSAYAPSESRVLIRTARVERPNEEATARRVATVQGGAIASSIVRVLRRSSPMKEHSLFLATQQMCRGSFIVTREAFEQQIDQLRSMEYIKRQGADSIGIVDQEEAVRRKASTAEGSETIARTFSNDPPAILRDGDRLIVAGIGGAPETDDEALLVTPSTGISRTYSAAYDIPRSGKAAARTTASSKFEIRDEDGLAAYLTSEVSKVSELLPELEYAQCAVLLDKYGWDRTRVLVDFEAKGAGSLIEVGRGGDKAKTADKAEAAPDGICPSCFDPLTEECVRLPCGHGQHDDCWQGYLSVNMNERVGRELLTTRCAGDPTNPNCTQGIPLRFFRERLTAEQRETYDKRVGTALLMSYFASCSAAVSCSCGRSLECRDVSVVVECECGAKFCVGCKRRGAVVAEAHGPASCAAIQQWTSLCTEGGVERFRLLRIKPCPGCGAPVDKCGCSGPVRCSGMDVCPNAACDHITCTSCKHEWCWVCSGPHPCRGDHSVPSDAKEKFLAASQRVKEIEAKINGLEKKSVLIKNGVLASLLQPRKRPASAAAAVASPQTSTGIHDFSGTVCVVCSSCGACTGYGDRCALFRLDRPRGVPCGCGTGDSGCRNCHRCKTCSEIVPCDAPSATETSATVASSSPATASAETSSPTPVKKKLKKLLKAMKPVSASQQAHRFVRDHCRVCASCGACTGFGTRCCMHKEDRERGSRCGCGQGEAGCELCGMCRACGAKSSCQKQTEAPQEDQVPAASAPAEPRAPVVEVAVDRSMIAPILLQAIKAQQAAQMAIKNGHIALHLIPLESQNRALLELQMAGLTQLADQLALVTDKDGQTAMPLVQVADLATAIRTYASELSALRLETQFVSTVNVIACQRGAACAIKGCTLFHVGRDVEKPAAEAEAAAATSAESSDDRDSPRTAARKAAERRWGQSVASASDGTAPVAAAPPKKKKGFFSKLFSS